MAIYSKTLSDEKIIALVPKGAKSILIVGCGGCVNESLAYDYDVPISTFDTEGNNTPYASSVEAKRIADILEAENFTVDIKLLTGDLPVLCIHHENETAIIGQSNRPDAILVLSCKSGVLGMQFVTDIPSFTITTQVGYLSYTYSDRGGERLILRDKSVCQLFDEQ